ncbi:hypothetical protein OZ664_20020 [Elizabethkingia sp. HX WHF]|uniref:Uncharacterized protein n=1 Tax=Elizabethkingia miricola TaxID=172045 RepID=A0ABY3NAT7_ELIMR|nr:MULTISPECIES: hypothetical protein [Elizabethkingia]MDX8566306.1 hypothetical protein [Elizabethkingia sp. HX WHF]TYO83763.1 hypothetical protein LX74_04055 [Elizabethkingia miricola]
MLANNPFAAYVLAALAIVAFICCVTTLAMMGIDHFKNKKPWNMW